MANIAEADSFQGRNQREIVAGIETPWNPGLLKRVEDGSVLEAEPLKTLPQDDFRHAGAVIQAAGRCRVDEQAIGPCGSGHGRVPVVAYYEFLRERLQRRQLLRCVVATHYVAGISVVVLVRLREAAVLNRG